MSEAATIHELAEASGVSVPTVSRNMNDPGSVPTKSPALIVPAMGEPPLRASEAARSPEGVNPKPIGVTSARIMTNPDSIERVKGLQRAVEPGRPGSRRVRCDLVQRASVATPCGKGAA